MSSVTLRRVCFRHWGRASSALASSALASRLAFLRALRSSFSRARSLSGMAAFFCSLFSFLAARLSARLSGCMYTSASASNFLRFSSRTLSSGSSRPSFLGSLSNLRFRSKKSSVFSTFFMLSLDLLRFCGCFTSCNSGSDSGPVMTLSGDSSAILVVTFKTVSIAGTVFEVAQPGFKVHVRCQVRQR